MWWSLHEPRAITFVAVCTYFCAILVGTMMAFEGGDLVYQAPHHNIHGVILVVCGVLGIPAAWTGRWYIERVACFGLFGLGLLQAFAGLADLLGAINVTDDHISASWVFGIACWMSFGISRWFRVREQPYAPGSGPLPLATQEEIALYLLVAGDTVQRSEPL